MAGYTGPAGTNQGNWNGNGGGLGLTTGTRWAGNTAFGPSGGMARGYGSRDMKSLKNAGMAPTRGMYSNFNNLNGTPMFGGLLGNQQFGAMNANQAFSMAQRAFDNMRKPAQNPQPAGGPTPQQPIPSFKPPVPTPRPPIIGYLPGWPGTGMWWGDQPHFQNNEGLMTNNPGPMSMPPGGKYQDRVPQENGWSQSGSYRGSRR